MAADGSTQIEVRADRDRCVGSGMCTLTAPEVFDQDTQEGLVVLLRNRLHRADPDTEAAREAEGLCPAEAIRVG
jgi:ferredoxin